MPGRRIFAGTLLAALALFSAHSLATSPPPSPIEPPAAPPGLGVSAALSSQAKPAASTAKPASANPPLKTASAAPRQPKPSGPAWAALGAKERLALEPIAEQWDSLDSSRKRKWLELARRFERADAPTRMRMHERMNEWAKLSPEARRSARVNFAEAQSRTPSDRAEKWRKYQALSPEQKKALAASAPKAAATPALKGTSTPMSADKSRHIKLPEGSRQKASAPVQTVSKEGKKRIEANPAIVNPKTLIPSASTDKAQAQTAN